MKMVTDDRKANVSLLKHGHVVPPITDRCRQVGWVGTCPDRCSGDHYVMILIIKVVVMIRLMVITVVVNSHDVEWKWWCWRGVKDYEGEMVEIEIHSYS